MDKISFQNLPNTTTPVNASNLNLLQSNVESAINSVVENGYNTNGYYIKYSDGTMICIKEVSTTVDCSHAWGNLYENSTAINFGNWAATFASRPYVIIEKTGGRGSWIQTFSDTSATSAGIGYIASATVFNAAVVFTCLAIGKWK